MDHSDGGREGARSQAYLGRPDLIVDIMRVLREHAVAADALTPEAELAAIGVDSLAFVGAVLTLEMRFAVSFPSDMLTTETFRTPATIARAISALQGQPR